MEPYLTIRTVKRAIPWEGQFMVAISPSVKSYISGFLDADGCIMFQLVRRKDYIYGYQIRASIVFYQNESKREFLEWLHKIFAVGYIRNRKDTMCEYTIVGLNPVISILRLLRPYVRLKKEHINLALRINKLVGKKTSLTKLVKAAELVDGFGYLNYSKKRTNTSAVLKFYLRQHKLYPRND